MSKEFDIFEINLKRPIEASWKVAGWMLVGVPTAVALVWGVYNPGNLFSVFGVSARRAAITTITETQPIGESLLNGTSGGGFRPGMTEGLQQSDVQYLRPGLERTENPDATATPSE